MSDQPTEPVVLDEKGREAVHAARDAAFAIEVTRQAQARDMMDKAASVAVEVAAQKVIDERRMGQIVQERVEHVLSMGTERERAVVLARVPYICAEITNINSMLEEIRERTTYMPLIQKLVFGLVGMCLVGFMGALSMLVFK